MKNWKTTTTGAIVILGVVAKVMNGGVSNISMSDITTLIGGIGLIMAKDSNVTGGTVGQLTTLQAEIEKKGIEVHTQPRP